MKIKKNYVAVIAVFISALMLMVGCTNKENRNGDEVNITKLKKGAYRNSFEGEIRTYSLNNDDVYENISSDEVIVFYNNKSGNYVYVNNNEVFVKYNGKDIKIYDKNIQNIKLSKDGSYLFYFVKNDYLTPVVISLKDERRIQLDNKAVISGQFIDWLSESKLVYYGVRNEDKKSGIFTYDLTTGNEELVYEISKGYISYLEVLDDEVLFIEDNMENTRILLSIDKEKQFREITDRIIDLKDVIKIDDKIYILGKVKDGVYSVYELIDDKMHRIVYDFPLMINLNKGLSCNEKGELLFMGSNDDYNQQNIYSYIDESVKLVTHNLGDSEFIKMN